MIPYVPDEEQQRREAEALARLVREGVRPEGVRARLALSFDKLTGRVPRGVDASNPLVRKAIGGGFELLALAKYGFFGSVLGLVGALFVWAGFYGGFDLQMLAAGTVLLIVAAWLLKSAREAWRNWKIIAKA